MKLNPELGLNSLPPTEVGRSENAVRERSGPEVKERSLLSKSKVNSEAVNIGVWASTCSPTDQVRITHKDGYSKMKSR